MQWIILYICNTGIGFRDGEESFCTFSTQVCLTFSAALAVRVKEEGLFCVYQHPSSYCNSLSMSRYQCPEMLKHLKSADLFNVLEIRNGLLYGSNKYHINCSIVFLTDGKKELCLPM